MRPPIGDSGGKGGASAGQCHLEGEALRLRAEPGADSLDKLGLLQKVGEGHLRHLLQEGPAQNAGDTHRQFK